MITHTRIYEKCKTQRSIYALSERQPWESVLVASASRRL